MTPYLLIPFAFLVFAFIIRMPEIIFDSGFEFGGFEGWSAVVGLAE